MKKIGITAVATATALIALTATTAACSNHQGGVSPKTHRLYTKSDLSQSSPVPRMFTADGTNTWEDYPDIQPETDYGAAHLAPRPEATISGPAPGNPVGRSGVYSFPGPHGSAADPQTSGTQDKPQIYSATTPAHDNRTMAVDAAAADRVKELNGVRTAHVVATEKNVYAAIQVRRGSPFNLSVLREQIESAVLGGNSAGRTVYVSTDPGFFAEVDRCATELRKGTRAESLLPTFNTIAERWFPPGAGMSSLP